MSLSAPWADSYPKNCMLLPNILTISKIRMFFIYQFMFSEDETNV